jgi:hypothetical protein
MTRRLGSWRGGIDEELKAVLAILAWVAWVVIVMATAQHFGWVPE